MSDVRGESHWCLRDRGLNILAVLTAVCTFPLLFVGGLVTSYDVGMAVPDWPTTFEENMFTYSWLEAPLGVQIEHSHRLLGSLVGFLGILLVVGSFVLRSPGWLKKLSIAALLAIILQGVLGGLRVILNANVGRELAAVHGAFGQATFALLVAIGVFTSRSFREAVPVAHGEARQVQWTTLLMAVLVYLQIVLGAGVRHLGAGFVLHLVLAGGLTLLLFWTVFVVALHGPVREKLIVPVALFVGLFVIQVFLGVGAMYLTGLTPPGFGTQPKNAEAIVATLHQTIGSLLLAIAVILVLNAFRRLTPEGKVSESVAATPASQGHSVAGAAG
ncbi:MAG: COX15/CtaA family protein [Planctomycetota bacterium]